MRALDHLTSSRRVSSLARVGLLGLALAASASPSVLAAQSSSLEPGDSPPHEPLPARGPRYRIELLGPYFGVGVFLAPAAGYDRTIYAIAGELRVVHRSGHGVQLRVAGGGTLWGDGLVAEPAYVYRFRLDGDDRAGVGLDVSAGPTLPALRPNESTLPAGDALGGHVGLSLDGRIEGFTISLAGQYRVLVPLGGAPAGNATGPEHALTAMLGLGFGFWG